MVVNANDELADTEQVRVLVAHLHLFVKQP
jgi:hypothetical protein